MYLTYLRSIVSTETLAICGTSKLVAEDFIYLYIVTYIHIYKHTSIYYLYLVPSI